MRYPYFIVDVFTSTRFGGNPLAVLPDANGLSDEQMQAIAREFNYSESTFVFPADNDSNDAKVRIFTPSREIPFAGHPNVGTAFVLSLAHAADTEAAETTLQFEELAGVVPVRVCFENGVAVYSELTAPQALVLGPELDADDLTGLADALLLKRDDIVVSNHFPRLASVGLPFLVVELIDVQALGRARVRVDAWDRFRANTDFEAIYIYTLDTGKEGLDVRGRMFAPNGVGEDPATGSANCAMAGLLASLASERDATLNYHIAQGVEMGRPSELLASVDKRGGDIAAVRIGGASVLFAEGSIDI